jgi:hypothetical protein
MQQAGYPRLVQTGNGHVPPVSGKHWLYEGKRGSTWYLKVRRPVRLPDGRVVTRQQNIRLGPAWVPGQTGRGACPEGLLNARAAKAECERILTEIRAASIIEASPRVVTVADAAEAWFAWGEHRKRTPPGKLVQRRARHVQKRRRLLRVEEWFVETDGGIRHGRRLSTGRLKMSACFM